MARLKLISWLLLGGLLVLAGVGAALMFVDPAMFRGQLEAGAAAAFGRPIQLGGPIRLDRSLTPRLVIGDIKIPNPEGHRDDDLATAEEVAVQVALLPLLRGDLQVLEVRFSGVKIFLEAAPDGAGTYPFGDSAAPGSGGGTLPSIERILIQDAALAYRSVTGAVTRYEIHAARLWNLPGEPERVEAEGSAKGVPFRIFLAADAPAEASGSHLPWSARLEVQCPDLALIASGRVARVFDWDRFDLRIAVKGDRPDTIENLFDVDLGGIGAFEITGSLEAADGACRLTELGAQIQRRDGGRILAVTDGTASGGRDTPLQLALQGTFGDDPLSVTLASERPPAAFFEGAAWPLESRVRMEGAELDLRGATTAAGSRVDLYAALQGEDLGALARRLGGETFAAGRFRASSHAVIERGGWQFADLEGEIQDLGPWRKVQLAQGRAFFRKDGSVSASLAAELDHVPLSLSLQAGPEVDGVPAGSARPFELEASAAGAALTAAGTVVARPDGRRFEAAVRVSGSRLERLGVLIGASLPSIAAYELSGALAHAPGRYELRDLSARLGGSRLSGSLQWEEKRPRPLLSGSLSVERLVPKELQPPPQAGRTAAMDRPLRIDWLGALDARVRLDVAEVAGSPVPIEKISSDVNLKEGALAASIRGRVAGARLQGQVGFARRRDVPHLSVKAAIGAVDAGRALRQLNLPPVLAGTVKSLHIDGRSSGRTPRALVEQAELSVRAEPDGLEGAGTILRRKVDLDLAAFEAAAGRGRGVTAVLAGSLNQVPFDATIGTGSIAELYDPAAPLPVRLVLRAGEVQLKAEGAVVRPFSRREFDLTHELTGREIKGLDPLMDIVLPLQGEFHARGKVSARAEQFTYEEELRVGRSDLNAVVTVTLNPARPLIAGRIRIGELHTSDLILAGQKVDAGSAPTPARVIPDHPIPAEIFRAADVDLDLHAGRIAAGSETLGDLDADIKIQNGRYHSVHSVSGVMGGRMEGEVTIDAAADPPSIGIRLQAEELDYRLLQPPGRERDLIEGRIAFHAELAGAGETVRGVLQGAQGRLTLIGGPGRISDRRVDLWAADLLPTMLSPRWQRENVTEMNCAVAHLTLSQGLAQVEDFLLDTRRITVAGGGLVNLETEALDLLIAPRPKRTSLVSLANPVRIRGTLAQPEVSTERLPSRRRLARTGILAGLVNPLFLLTMFVDTGTVGSNPCVQAVERANQAAEIGDSQ
jgi:uncharacterized protein involved in outer membrane biogenesis